MVVRLQSPAEYQTKGACGMLQRTSIKYLNLKGRDLIVSLRHQESWTVVGYSGHMRYSMLYNEYNHVACFRAHPPWGLSKRNVLKVKACESPILTSSTKLGQGDHKLQDASGDKIHSFQENNWKCNEMYI